MDTRLDGLDQAQQEFHKSFDMRMKDVKDDILILKTNINIVKINLDALRSTITESVESTHHRLENGEDCMDSFMTNLQSQHGSYNSWIKGALLETGNVRRQFLSTIKSWLVKFEEMNVIIDHKFIHVDSEMERVSALVEAKIKLEFEKVSNDFLEAIKSEERRFTKMEDKIWDLEARLDGHCTDSMVTTTAILVWVGDLEDTMMDEEVSGSSGPLTSSSSSTDVGERRTWS